MNKYGFIGLGSQGAPMAQQMIDKGLDVVLWARRPESLEPFAKSKATLTSDIQSLAKQVQFCGICVVDDAGVQQVCSELIPAMPQGGCIAIHSTIDPALCQKLAEDAKKNGLTLIDAPVSGGGEGAAAGTLTVMVGGDDQIVERVKPVFETFAGNIIHLGSVGAGQNAKLVNNSLMAANLAIAHHGIEAARQLGIDPDAFANLVKVSSGHSFSFNVRARMPEPKAFSHGAKLLLKDVNLLGQTLGDDPNYTSVRNAAMPFLELALEQ